MNVTLIRANGSATRALAQGLQATSTVSNGGRNTTFRYGTQGAVLRTRAGGRYFVLRVTTNAYGEVEVSKVSAHSSRDLALKALQRVLNKRGYDFPIVAVEVA